MSKARVLKHFPNAKCTKDSATRQVVITLGATARDHYTHQDRDRFEFVYGTAVECWGHVSGALKLMGSP